MECRRTDGLAISGENGDAAAAEGRGMFVLLKAYD